MTTLTTKSIKDYLHFYVGGDVMYPNGEVHKLRGTDVDYILTHPNPAAIKPILRNLSDMTEEEMEEVWHLEEPKNVLTMEGKHQRRQVALCSERTRYLLSKQFDLYNLIPEGLAIDKQTLKQS